MTIVVMLGTSPDVVYSWLLVLVYFHSIAPEKNSMAEDDIFVDEEVASNQSTVKLVFYTLHLTI